ncbi:MAG: peptidoglycan DD-metalloendopeptidase family protein [Propionibacteriaceae bacterium]|jgi:murein DD-endopeptidase MepM/ murein hydrolase activator NlpD|nr:peptidoglycan DD-metalloendopeptidase family protein [Propionibacteriaceae bacterium]
MGGCSRLRRLVAGLGVPVLAAALALGSAPAVHADPADDTSTGSENLVSEPNTIEEARTLLEQLEVEQSELNLQISETQQRLDAAQAQLTQTEAGIAEIEATIEAKRVQLTQIALQQYQTQGISQAYMFFASDADTMLDQMSSMERLSETTNQHLQDFYLQQTNLEDLERSQQSSFDEVAEARAGLADLEAEMQVKVTAANAALTRLTAEAEAKAAAARAAVAAASGASVAAGSTASLLPSSGGFVWPTSGTITSNYGGRIHPIYGSYAFHDGLDLGASCGTPAVAAANGVVTDAYYTSGYGNRLFVDNGIINGQHIVTSYNHLQGFASSVGQSVSQGETVAYVGTTGASTGCHLHFMVWVNGTLTDPLNYL